MILAIITILSLVILQFIIGSIWYSKLLFGYNFVSLSKIDLSKIDKKQLKIIYTKELMTSLIKSVLIYLISYDLFILQSFYLFKFIILIAILVSLYSFSNIWGRENIQLSLIKASHNFISIISSFILAFTIYSMFV